MENIGRKKYSQNQSCEKYIDYNNIRFDIVIKKIFFYINFQISIFLFLFIINDDILYEILQKCNIEKMQNIIYHYYTRFPKNTLRWLT